MDFAIIAAADDTMGIGIGNKLPWRLKGDLAYFSDVTTKAASGLRNAVIMGRNTWLSLPEKSKPLHGRLNVVLCKEEMDLPEGVLRAVSFEDAFEKIEKAGHIGKVFVIGGANVYAQAIQLNSCTEVYLTRVRGNFSCDTFFPQIPAERFKLASSSDLQQENGIQYTFTLYTKK